MSNPFAQMPAAEWTAMNDPIDDFDLSRFLPYRLNVAASRVSRALADRYGAEAGISIPEWRVLAHLHHSGSVSVRDIQVRVDMDKSKVSRAASRLAELGYVIKVGHETDGRLVSLTLSPEGKALMVRLLAVASDYDAQLRARLGDLVAAFDQALDSILEMK